MQRRPRQTSGDLPVTMSDVGRSSNQSQLRGKGWNNSTTNRRNKHGSKKKQPSALLTCGLFIVVIILIGLLLTFDFNFVPHSQPDGMENVKTMSNNNNIQQPLSVFTSLQYALNNADIIGLYFGAKWCPHCAPITATISTLFSDKGGMDNRLLQPIRNKVGDIQHDYEHKDFALVYVSSDRSEEEMISNLRWNWIDVPYDSPERKDIQRHYRACAHMEMEDLGIDPRRYHIPTLLIIDSATHGVLSANGVDDLDEYGNGVLDYWLQLQHLQRAMEDKYESENYS